MKQSMAVMAASAAVVISSLFVGCDRTASKTESSSVSNIEVTLLRTNLGKQITAQIRTVESPTRLNCALGPPIPHVTFTVARAAR